MPTSMNLFAKKQVVTDLLGHDNWSAPISASEIKLSLEKLGKRRWIFWKRPPVIHLLSVEEGVGHESFGYQLELEGGGQLNLIKVGLPQPEKEVEEGQGAFIRKTKRIELKWQYLVWIGVPDGEVSVNESVDWKLKSYDSFGPLWADVLGRVRIYQPVISAK